MHWFVAQLPALIVGLVLLSWMFSAVSRRRLERFALRQRLCVTVDNGPIVVKYLAVTRRWRAGGFLAGAAVDFGLHYTQTGSRDLTGLAALIGWFLGAVIAEWQVQTQRDLGERRAASLEVRRLADYLPRYFMIVAAAAWLAAIGIGIYMNVRLDPMNGSAIGDLVAAAVITPAIWSVAAHTLGRPQPAAAADVRAADDALRSRSIHVFAGCTIAVNGILAALLVSQGQFVVRSVFPGSAAMIIDLCGGFLMPAVGLVLATTPFAVRRRAHVKTLRVAA